jgi:hypothetical protein
MAAGSLSSLPVLISASLPLHIVWGAKQYKQAAWPLARGSLSFCQCSSLSHTTIRRIAAQQPTEASNPLLPGLCLL